MKIDILMATYNGSEFIENQIFSLIGQTYKKWNLIIHDDGSSDNTIEIIKKIAVNDERIKIIDDNVKCGGAGANFMHLLKYSYADYVMFCDQDDVWFDNKVELHLAAIEARNNNIPQVVYSNAYVWVPDQGIKGLATLTFPRKLNQFLFLNSGMQGCVAVFNKEMRETMLIFRGTLAMHDHLLHLSALCLGEVSYLPICLMLYRNHDKNVTGDTATSSSNIKNIIKNFRLPVVDKTHYLAVCDFYSIYYDKLNKVDLRYIEYYMKMYNTSIIDKLIKVIVTNFQIFNSRWRLIVKILIRPYNN